MRPRFGLLVAGAVLGVSIAAAGGLCKQWSDGETVGTLDADLISEASGLAISALDPERLYHVNDSGGGPFVYRTARDGSGLGRLHLRGARVYDSEAVAVGLVDGAATLVVGDIGDNDLIRRTIRFFAVPEETMTDIAAPVATTLTARYPDGPHNAEAMALGPGGTLYIFTKSWTNRRQDPAPSYVYRLPVGAWTRAAGETVTLEPVGSIDLPALATREKAPFSDVVTDAAMSADGSRLLLLTYGYAWELDIDLAAEPVPPAEAMRRGEHYELIRLQPLLGKETIAYLPGDRSFLFGKEYKPDRRPSVLIQMDCLAH